jgi:prepilin-type N-terminal cleavage/methylation domain-containing protein
VLGADLGVAAELGVLRMRLAVRALQRLRRSERGLTLIEMLVASSLGLVVVGGAATLFTQVIHNEPVAESKATGIQFARTAIDQMTREIRAGSAVSTATATQLSLVTYVDQATCGGSASTSSRLCQVTYTCSAGACTRAVTNPGVAGSGGRTVVSGLSSNSVFSYSPSSGTPTYVNVTLAFPSTAGTNAITLSDGVSLRNYTPTS